MHVCMFPLSLWHLCARHTMQSRKLWPHPCKAFNAVLSLAKRASISYNPQPALSSISLSPVCFTTTLPLAQIWSFSPSLSCCQGNISAQMERNGTKSWRKKRGDARKVRQEKLREQVKMKGCPSVKIKKTNEMIWNCSQKWKKKTAQKEQIEWKNRWEMGDEKKTEMQQVETERADRRKKQKENKWIQHNRSLY